jgi:hypothetical protein
MLLAMAVRSARIGHNAAGHTVKACGEIDNSRLREAGTAPALDRLGIPDFQIGEDVKLPRFRISSIYAVLCSCQLGRVRVYPEVSISRFGSNAILDKAFAMLA